jgi:hemerythrin-like metal-binding protein
MTLARAKVDRRTQTPFPLVLASCVVVIDQGPGLAPLASSSQLVIQADTIPKALAQLDPRCDPVAVVIADDLPATPFPEAARQLLAVLPSIPLIALTADPAVANVVFLMQAGASDVLVRPLDAAGLYTAAARFTALLRRGDALARREREVFTLLGDGCTTAEIAKRLHLNAKTIDGTVIRLRAKLACEDTAALRRAAVLHHRHGAVRSAVALTIPVTGHPAIDGQHGSILALISRLELELERPDIQLATIAATADEFLALVHQHAACEIALMEDSGYPAAQAHRDEHAALLAELATMRSHLDTARPSSLAAFRSFLLHWLGQHIPRCDQPLVQHLASRQGAPTAADGRAPARP